MAENIALQAEFCNLVTVPLHSSEQLFFILHGNTMLEEATLMWCGNLISLAFNMVLKKWCNMRYPGCCNSAVAIVNKSCSVFLKAYMSSANAFVSLRSTQGTLRLNMNTSFKRGAVG